MKQITLISTIVLLLFMPAQGVATVGTSPLFSNKFGKITARYRPKHSFGVSPMVEHVTLFVPLTAGSSELIERKGILIWYPHAQATIIINHGFMCSSRDVGFLRHLFPEGKYNFLTYDFRAHGENAQGQCCTFGKDETNEVTTAAEFVKHYGPLRHLPLIAYGFSMGAAAAIEAQALRSDLFIAMVLDCPYDSTESVLRTAISNIKISFFGLHFGVPGRSLLEKYIYHPYVQSLARVLLKTILHIDPQNIDTFIRPLKPAESVKNITVPCFFIHCKNDDKFSVEAAKAVFNGAAGYKELWLSLGRRHFDSLFYNPELYKQRVNHFVERVLAGTLPAHSMGTIIEDSEG